MPEIIDLSGYVEEGQPVYPGNQRTQFFVTATHEEAGHAWRTQLESDTDSIQRKLGAADGTSTEHPSCRSVLISEHGPTHVDALTHLSPELDGSIDKLPLERFYGDAVGLGLSNVDADEFIEPNDLQQALDEHNLELRDGDAVLLHTGHRKRTYSVDDYEQRHEYMYNYTGLNRAAAEWLATQGVRNIGIDSPSIDSSDAISTKEYPAHDVCAEHEMLNMENMANLDAVAGRRFTLCAFPLKLRHGTGSPIRPVAIIE